MAQQHSGPSVRVRVLLLEDDPSYAQFVCHHLGRDFAVPCQVEVFGTLQDALARMARGDIDLVISDLNVPDSHGTATIAALAATSRQPIIGISADDEPGLREQAMQGGAYEFLPKRSLNKATLERHVRLAALQAEALRELKESEARFRSMTELSSDWFWETDAEYRFVNTPARVTVLDWGEHRQALERREIFRDLELVQVKPDGERTYLHVAGEPVFGQDGAFRGYRGTARDITRRKTNERLLALEHRVASVLSGGAGAPEALLEVLTAVCRSEAWDCGRYFEVDQRAARLRLRVSWAATEAMERFNRESAALALARGEGLAGTVWQSGEALWVPDVHRDSRTAVRDATVRAGVHGAFLFPVEFGGELLGVMSFSSAFVREPDERLQQTMRVIAGQIGRFLRHKADERSLHESEVRLRDLYNNAPCGYHSLDADGVFVQMNDTELKWLGLEREEVIGRMRFTDVLTPEGVQLFHKTFHVFKQPGEAARDLEYQLRHKDGSLRSVLLSSSAMRDAQGRFVMSRSTLYDISDRKEAEERIRYLAQHDALTGLPNRLLLQDRINQAIAQAHRSGRMVAVLFIDLDHFKHINDSLGHEVGDGLLRAAAVRLQECLREGDSVCRLGGDEFVISLPSIADSQDAAVVASKVLEALARPFHVDGRELHVGGSIGISVSPNDGQDANALMRAADTAMYHAKEKGRNNYRFFTPALNDAAQHRLALAGQLRQALAQNEFALHYQPQVDLETGEVFSVEALLRWQKPGEEPISCADFISVAEETGLISPLGEWALREACEQLKRWRAGGHRELQVAVNLSARQFYQASFHETVARVLRETGLPASALELEITESLLMLPSHENLLTLERLAKMGVRLSVDDFGMGYSSLAYLQRFPIHSLKIDRSFVSGIGHDASHTAIVTAIIAMAQSLRLKMVAEGVENAEQVRFLKSHGCLAAQGYFYGRPQAAAALEPALRRPAERSPAL